MVSPAAAGGKTTKAFGTLTEARGRGSQDLRVIVDRAGYELPTLGDQFGHVRSFGYYYFKAARFE